MVYALSYRRPSHVTWSQESFSGVEKQQSINESIGSCSSCMSNGIPPALSFDRIVDGGTCPPVTARDFMNYLRYIEHSAENLQFFLWFRDYQVRFERLRPSEKSLASEWIPTHADQDIRGSFARPKQPSSRVTALLKETDFAGAPKVPLDKADPFNTPPKSASFDDKRDFASESEPSVCDDGTLLSNSGSAHKPAVGQAFDDAGIKWKPFTTQPYRDEVNRIIGIYIAEHSPRELNLSAKERQAVMHALQHTTHPSAFKTIVTTVEFSLRRQAHPNFIRWTICNGNRPRVLFARGLGVFGILVGFIADLLITLSHANRAWRLLPVIAWFFGIATLIAAWKGMCVVLHGLHHRHLRPWELFSDAPEEMTDEKAAITDYCTSGLQNSFEEEPWVPRYKKRNIVRKIFDREVWVQEPALRQIQDTIFLQAILGSLMGSCVVVGIFCAVPQGNLY